jgi:hypothetical protein
MSQKTRILTLLAVLSGVLVIALLQVQGAATAKGVSAPQGQTQYTPTTVEQLTPVITEGRPPRITRHPTRTPWPQRPYPGGSGNLQYILFYSIAGFVVIAVAFILILSRNSRQNR